jgi:phosphate transport system permease protein
MKTVTKQKIAFTLLFLCTLIVVLPVLFVLMSILKGGLPAINWQFLSAMPYDGMRQGGIYPAIIGTIYLVSLSILFSLPLGLFAAIYLNEYAKDNLLTRLIRLAIVNLSGVSSVVYGLFGLALFVNFLKFGVSILSGALTLAIMNLPVIVTASCEALGSVPVSFREVSLSLGASRWQTVRHSVLPNAIPGILTGAILSLARAAGETAPILFTVAAFYLPKLPKSVFDQAMALPYHLYIISTQIPNIKTEIRYGTALVLIGIVFSMNIFAVVIRSKFRKKKKW